MVQRQLTVLQVLPALRSGGVERGTLEVARHLVAHGHRSLVVSAGGGMVDQLTAEGSEHLTLPIGRKSLLTLRLVPALRRYLREQQVDVLHIRSRMPGWVAFLAWRGMDPATRPHLVSTVHGMYSVNAYSAVMTRGERVIAVSDTVRDYVAANYPRVDTGRIEVIHRGIDPAEYPPGFRPSAGWLANWSAEYPQLADRKIITLPGRITRLKGHEDFLRLLGRLCAQDHTVHGLIVGGAEPRKQRYLQELHAQIAQLGLADHVSFTGQRGDLREILAISDIVLSLSNKPESFGRTTLEALAMGVPVLGYDHGGVGEILRRHYPAGRVPLHDIAALTHGCMAISRGQHIDLTAPPTTLRDMLDATLALYEAVSRTP
ncbi:MAG: glycosyltransferase family 4 protein [Rhodoferax sp.]|nr:glycosyltransferase family 4 protein [Rhodoferax sp.]